MPYTSPGSPRKDSKGNDCNNVGGIMDYHPTKDHDVRDLDIILNSHNVLVVIVASS